jgi:hypothetical protein
MEVKLKRIRIVRSLSQDRRAGDIVWVNDLIATDLIREGYAVMAKATIHEHDIR